MFQSKLEVYFRYKDLFEKDPKDWTLEEFEDFCAELGECTFCPFNDNADRTECTNFYIIRDGKRLLDEYKKEVHETLQEVVSTAQSVSITKWTPTNIKPKDLVGLAINSSFNISTQENLYRVDYFYSPYQDKVIMKPFADLSVGEVYISMSSQLRK